MKNPAAPLNPTAFARPHRQRGSVLVTALLIATALGVGLAGFLMLSRTALKLSHRTLFINDASNLAEAGLEEALYCFNRVNAGVATATAWTGWTISGSTARRTLAPFNRDQNAVGTVRVFVNDYNGGGNPYIVSQATIAPFDRGAPIVRIMRLGMKKSGLFVSGLVGINGVSIKGKPLIDSFNSNPTNSPTGPWLEYSSKLSASNSTVIVKKGKIDLGKAEVKGNVILGPDVDPPSDSQVTGTITTNFTGEFTMPPYPTAASVTQSYNLGKKIPERLPVAGHVPASDGRYYYFVTDTTIEDTTIVAGANVAIIGTKTDLKSGVTISANAALAVYIDGDVDVSRKGSINSSNWAGALQIFTTTDEDCNINGSGELCASVYAPYAKLKASGGSSGSIVGSFIAKSVEMGGQMSFHYDEALRNLETIGGNGWAVDSWAEISPALDSADLKTMTGGFLP